MTYDSEDVEEAQLSGPGPCIHHWGIEVEDRDSYVAKIKASGGTIISKPGEGALKFRAAAKTASAIRRTATTTSQTRLRAFSAPSLASACSILSSGTTIVPGVVAHRQAMTCFGSSVLADERHFARAHLQHRARAAPAGARVARSNPTCFVARSRHKAKKGGFSL
jgi:hypothetical protein